MKISKSPKINKALFDIGVSSYFQVLNHLPYRYENMALTHENNLIDKERIVLEGTLLGSPTLSRFRNMSLTKFTFISKNKNIFYVEAWNRPYLRSMLNNVDTFTLVGNYDLKKKTVNLININKGVINKENTIKPIYSLPRAIENYQYINFVKKSFEELEGDIYDVIPHYFMKKYRLETRENALKLVHFPSNFDDIKKGLRVLKYEECLLFSLKTQMIRNENKALSKDPKQHIDIEKVKDFYGRIKYSLTSDQEKALNEILKDMNSTSLMYRLLQGDVGTGKTLVAALALYANTLRNDQGALMAPTDTLARQHFLTLINLFKDTDLKIALLVGSTPKKERTQILKGLINHEIDIIVGTHALFSDDVSYSSLGLAIIDEQHRFGVNQRLMLTNKGSHSDLLLMSATPIPRTLSMTIYGDLDVSSLYNFPSGKREVVTSITKSNSKSIYKSIDESLKNNKKTFIIAPLIDEGETDRISTEKLFAHFALKYPGKVSYVHGKMSLEEKNQALLEFIKGDRPILVSTTVIEVGLDVKDANLMIVYESNSFGLASLHQLRGRVGRDGTPSKFILVYDDDNEDDIDKLNVLVSSDDGFKIAEEDMKRRGPGEIAGTRQSGLPSFTFANLINDFKMFEVARDDATFILNNENEPGFKYIIKLAKSEINNALFTNV